MKTLREQMLEFHYAAGMPMEDLPKVPGQACLRACLAALLQEFFGVLEACVGSLDPGVLRAILERDASALTVLRADLVALVGALGRLDRASEGARLALGVDGRPVAELIHKAELRRIYNCTACEGAGALSGDRGECSACEGRGKRVTASEGILGVLCDELLRQGWVAPTDNAYSITGREEREEEEAREGLRIVTEYLAGKSRREVLKEQGVFDPVDRPKHYNVHPSGVECIDIVKHMTYCRGTAVSYIWRAGLKDDELEDLRKARWFLDEEIARVEKEREAKKDSSTEAA